MLLFRRKKDLIAHLATLKNTSTSVGLVPTMGALHEVIRLSGMNLVIN
ncbi:pantoate--beta-alanine ligase, partial [Bacteroidota bacterium]